jgi:hypothetical protein
VKIKFDENVSTRLVDAISILETDTAIELTSVHRDYGEGIADPDWMFRFRDEGGIAMVSGDHAILQKPVNLKAYTEAGLISIWPSPGWPDLKRWGQSALMIRWWPLIKKKIAASSPGDRGRVPMIWTPTLEAFKPLRDPRVDG